jgi:hypothetical protein
MPETTSLWIDPAVELVEVFVFRFLLSCGVLVGIVGCGGQDGPKWDLTTHPVSGRVFYDGKAAEGVLVGLYPMDAPMPPAIPENPHGVTKSDGSFNLTTFKDGDGACEGNYQILLTWMNKGSTEDEEKDVDKLLGWYDAAHSNLYFTVKKGENTVPNISIPPRKVKPEAMPGIPGRN